MDRNELADQLLKIADVPEEDSRSKIARNLLRIADSIEVAAKVTPEMVGKLTSAIEKAADDIIDSGILKDKVARILMKHGKALGVDEGVCKAIADDFVSMDGLDPKVKAGVLSKAIGKHMK